MAKIVIPAANCVYVPQTFGAIRVNSEKCVTLGVRFVLAD